MKSFQLALMLVAIIAFPLPEFAEPIWVSVVPSQTDPEIHTFDTPHSICVDHAALLRGGNDRHEMLLFLPGTNGTHRGAKAFLQTAAEQGYHVIELMYPDDVSASVCDGDSDPKAFEDFRMAIIAGGSSPHMTIPRAESIENRLIKLLLRLEEKRPRERWDQFIQGSEIQWSHIVVAGQSQGGGHAALIAIKHKVSRVIMFGAPKDYSRALHAPAAWNSEASATPPSAFYGINHQQDHQACSFAEVIQNQVALHMDQFGPPMNVDAAPPPYGHAHILTTNYPGTQIDSKTAHTSAISEKNQAVFRPMWIYMLTEI